MDELNSILHAAIDAALAGDRQALFIARWLLSDLMMDDIARSSGG